MIMKRVRRKVISDAPLIIISINLISWFGLGLAIIQDLELDSTGRSELSRNITRILNDLVHKEKYDKRLRPNYGGPPVEVGITIFVSSISAVSEVEMDFTLDIYLRQMWTDNRLAFTGVSRTHITIDVEYMKSIWVPDTFFPNEKKSFFHTTTTHNSFLRISNTGKITTSQRLTVTASCPMYLRLFPLDSQECTLEIESYGYSEDDIKYSWFPPRADTFKLDKNVRLPQFEVKHFTVVNKTQKLSTGSYSRLAVKLLFVRNIGFYMMQIYLPSMLIVIISWVSFWIHRDASPARVALGVTTVLTMTTLMSTTNASLPKVSYIKAIDIYLGTCFLMVFASLLEYAAVSYLNKKMKMKRERKKQHEQTPVQEFPMLPTTSKIGSPASFGVVPPTFYPFHGGTSSVAPVVVNNNNSTLDYQKLLPVSLTPSPFHHLECDCDLVGGPNLVRPVPLKISTKPKFRPRSRVTGVTPSAIDKYSRFVFPIVFFFFNVVYWIVCYVVSEQIMREIVEKYYD